MNKHWTRPSEAERSLPAVARFWRNGLRLVVNVLYRIDAVGADSVPREGGVLIASNHVSYADPFVLSAVAPRPLRFLMWRAIFDWRPLTWFFRLMRAIPVAGDDRPRALVESFRETRRALDAGDAVALFAEGGISRLPQMLGFRRGLEHLLRGTSFSIVPVHIDGLWGSALSFQAGRFFWKRPRRSPDPIRVSFGAPLSSGASAFAVRQAVLELGAGAFARRSRPHTLQAALSDCRRRDTGAAIETSTETAPVSRFFWEAEWLGRRLSLEAWGDGPIAILAADPADQARGLLAAALCDRSTIVLDSRSDADSWERTLRTAGTRFVLADAERHAALPIRLRQTARCFIGEKGEGALFRLGQATGATARRLLRASPKAEPSLVYLTDGRSDAGAWTQPSALLAAAAGLFEALDVRPGDRLRLDGDLSNGLGQLMGFWTPLLHGVSVEFRGADRRPAIERVRRERATIRIDRWEPISPTAPLNAEVLPVFGVPGAPVVSLGVPDVVGKTDRIVGARSDTAGRPLPGVALRVVTEDGNLAHPGDAGRLQIAGAAVSGLAMGGALSWRDTGLRAAIDHEGFVSLSQTEIASNAVTSDHSTAYPQIEIPAGLRTSRERE